MMDEEINPVVWRDADHWFARLRAPDCDAQQREAFEHWRQVPEHAAAYAQIEAIWQRFGAADATADPRLRALRERVLARTAASQPADSVGAHDPDRDRQPTTVRPLGYSRRQSYARDRRRRVVWLSSIAACLCIVAVMLAVYFVPGTVPETNYTTTDAIRSVTLPDGTRVKLDVNSELAVHYSARRRSVVLQHGRALFDVVHDSNRPFVVGLGDSHVTVLGTRFGVQRNAERISVTLQRGSLQLDGDAGTGSRSERLVPGDQVTYTLRNPTAWHVRHVDPATVLAWSRGRLVFHSTPLAEAVRKVNRYSQRKIRLGDPSLSTMPVSGNYIAGDSKLIVSAWAAILPLRVEERGKQIILLPARRPSASR